MQIKSKWLKSESSIDGQPPFNKSLRYRVPLKPRIDALLFRIGLEINKLEEIIKDLKFKDNEIFQKIIFSVTERNFQYHAVLLSELRYARRMNKVVYMSKIILEDLETKLRGVPDIDYLVPLLSTRVTVVRNIRYCLIPYIPEIEEELGLITELLGGILIDASQVGSHIINFDKANSEALRILNDASIESEQMIKKEFPVLPELQNTLEKS